MKLFCFGFGYSASYFAKSLDWASVYGTHRGDLPLSDKAREELAQATHVLLSVPPDANGDIIYRDQYDINAKWIGYLSTTGVYGNTDGDWVDETSPLAPVNDRSSWRALAEAQWLDSKLPVQIFRLSGIYGPGRSVIDDLRDGTARRIIKPNQFFSRIHVEDIAKILAVSAVKPTPGEIFNCADDYPCSAAEVVEYAASLIGVEPPPAIAFEQAELSPMARSFYSSSRRVRNNKIKQVLGVSLKYPTYREGLTKIWHESR